MKLYLVKSSNLEAYGDYNEFTELMIGNDKSDIEKQVKISKNHFQEDIIIEELSSIYGYDIKLESKDKLIGGTLYYEKIRGLEVFKESGEIIYFEYDELNKKQYTILTPNGNMVKVKESEIKYIF